jgi:cell division protein FtsW
METAKSNDLKAPVAFDLILIGVTLALVGFSLVMVYSTTGIVSQEKFGDPLYYVKRQSFAAIAGVAMMGLCSFVNVGLLKKVSPYLLPLSIFMLVVTMIPGLGDSAGGAQRWMKLGPIRFQPAEYVKVFFVIFMAGYLSRHEARIATFSQGILKPFLVVGVVAGLLLKQPDFGSTCIIIAVTLGMITAAGARLKYIILGGVALAMILGALVILSPYRMGRVISFLSPFSDASGKGYQLIQSLIAVGSGRMFGSGLGASQQKLFFLPAAHTDFIFAVIAEELGFFGCFLVIAAFLLFLYRGLKLAGRMTEDTFSYSLAVGLTMLIVVPALLNMGVVLGLLPTKGLVLPLVGYGGSSLVACLASIGLLLALAKNHQQQSR